MLAGTTAQSLLLALSFARTLLENQRGYSYLDGDDLMLPNTTL